MIVLIRGRMNCAATWKKSNVLCGDNPMSTNLPMADYSLQIAERRVELYSDLMAQHREAMACYTCEDFLEAGIQAEKWLRKADETLREAARLGINTPDEARAEIDKLYARWLLPCPAADEMIAHFQARGFQISRLQAFKEAEQNVRRRIAKNEALADLDEMLEGRGFSEQFWAEASRLRGFSH